VRRAFAAAILTVILAGGPVTAAEAAAPDGLSVSIRNGNSEVHSDDRLVYTATVRNGGVGTVEGRLVITVPAFVRITDAGSADRAGVDASWTVTVPPGGSVTKKLTGVLENIPKGQLRVTTLVGLYLGDATQPTIRSADAATIAGVKDPAHAVNDRAPSSATSAPSPIVWVGLGIGGIVLLAAIAGGWLVWRRRSQVVGHGPVTESHESSRLP
jgi:hypothetical protein